MLNPRCNVLLDQLTDAESQQVFPSLRLVSLTEGQLLYAPGDLIDQVYFPVTALVAIAKIMQGGLAMDVATVGKEGGIGFRGMLSRCPSRVYVTVAGLAYQISLQQLQRIQDQSLSPTQPGRLSTSDTWLNRMHVHAVRKVFDSMAVEAGCAHFHSARERVARWLLVRYAQGHTLCIEATHQKIADSLGVRRESVTNALLQLRGIEYIRNHIEIHDHLALESQACECHWALREPEPDGDPLQLSLLGHS